MGLDEIMMGNIDNSIRWIVYHPRAKAVELTKMVELYVAQNVCGQERQYFLNYFHTKLVQAQDRIVRRYY